MQRAFRAVSERVRGFLTVNLESAGVRNPRQDLGANDGVDARQETPTRPVGGDAVIARTGHHAFVGHTGGRVTIEESSR